MGKTFADDEQNINQVIQALKTGDPLSNVQRSRLVNKLKDAENEFKRSKRWIYSVGELLHIGLWEIKHQSNEQVWSDETYRLLGDQPNDYPLTFESCFARIYPEDRRKVKKELRESLKNKEPFQITFRRQLPNGQFKYIETNAIHTYNEKGDAVLTIGTSQDVTDTILKEKRLVDSLEKKQTLLEEIHHRVKNNLAVVAGLLQLQWLEESDPALINTLKEGANRLKAVANIHHQLYESDSLNQISLGENFVELAENVISTMANEKNIKLESNNEAVYLTMNQMMPCSLIANEVITNCIKHGFEGKKKGTITIELTRSDDTIKFRISDNGVGFPDDHRDKKGTLGMTLIENLTMQLNGDYNFRSSDNGVTFSMQFQKEES